MSEHEHILVRSGLSPVATAERLAALLGAELDRNENGAPRFTRPAVTVGGRLDVGVVMENDWGEDAPDPGDESIYDGDYDNVVELWVSGPADDELLHAEGERLYDEAVTGLRWPAVH